MSLNFIEYQNGLLTGYSGGFTLYEIKECFNLLYISYPNGCLWQHAIALSNFQFLN